MDSVTAYGGVFCVSGLGRGGFGGLGVLSLLSGCSRFFTVCQLGLPLVSFWLNKPKPKPKGSFTARFSMRPRVAHIDGLRNVSLCVAAVRDVLAVGLVGVLLSGVPVLPAPLAHGTLGATSRELGPRVTRRLARRLSTGAVFVGDGLDVASTAVACPPPCALGARFARVAARALQNYGLRYDPRYLG